ncbi:hypothetical protein [Streptomyces avermitilis]|uniref:hypothetical protein n=1 Tax=Streptomyces avermitilis TaxID=33903 RepID=UPI0037F40859
MLHGTLHTDSHLVVGLAAFLTFGSAAAAQLMLGRLPLPRVLTVGAVVFPAGLVLGAVARYHPALWLCLVAVSLSGAGSGLLFKGGVERAVSVAEPASRAGGLAVFFVVAYLGTGLPSVLFSIALRHFAVQTAMIGFAAALSCGADCVGRRRVARPGTRSRHALGAVRSPLLTSLRRMRHRLSGRRGPGHSVRARVTRIRGRREARDVCGIGQNHRAPLR